MKKYVKMLGLLLITGFVLAACGNETKDDLDVEVSEITLTNGKWKMSYSSSFEGLDASGASFVSTYVDSSRIQVSGDTLTIISGTYSQSYVYTFPESAAASDIEAFAQQKQEEQAEWEEEQETAGITVTTVSFEHTGRSVSITCAYEKTTKQIASQNQGASVSAMNSGLLQDAENIVIKTNPGRTEYKITFSIAPDPNFPGDVGRDIVLVFKKV
ncbi:MAG: hypothetical protein IKX70_05745 [Treponema sp.]|nr:hypothetical protein [Treponema sp.]